MPFLKLRLKIQTAVNGQPLSWAEQLAAMTSQKGKSLTKGEIRKLRHKHRQAEQKYRKSMQEKQKYVSPKVGGKLRNKDCTAIVDASAHAERGIIRLGRAQQRILDRAAELEAKGHKVTISTDGFGLTYDGGWDG